MNGDTNVSFPNAFHSEPSGNTGYSSIDEVNLSRMGMLCSHAFVTDEVSFSVMKTKPCYVFYNYLHKCKSDDTFIGEYLRKDFVCRKI